MPYFIDVTQLPEHQDIIHCIKTLYPNIRYEKGVCFGVESMHRQAFLCGKQEQFYEHLIDIKTRLLPLIISIEYEVDYQNINHPIGTQKRAQQIKDRLYLRLPYKDAFDLYSFLDGIAAYQSPNAFKHLFTNQHYINQHTHHIESLMRPIYYDDKIYYVDHRHYHIGVYSQHTLLTWISCLNTAFMAIDHPVACSIYTGNHAFGLVFHQKYWQLIDVNFLKQSILSFDQNNFGLLVALIKEHHPGLLTIAWSIQTPPHLPRQARQQMKTIIANLNHSLDWNRIHRYNTKEYYQLSDAQGYTLAYMAADFNDIKLLMRAITYNVHSISQPSSLGATPLCIASQCGHAEIVELMLDVLEDNIDAIKRPNSQGATAFFVAAKNGHLKIVALFIKALQLDLNALNTPTHHTHDTALIAAAHNGHIDVVRLIINALKNNPSAIHTPNRNGDTALIVAAHNGHTEITQLIITALQSNMSAINHSNNNGITALHAATKYGHTNIVMLLIDALQHNIEAIHQPNNDGITPLAIAASNGHTTIVSLLVDTLKNNVKNIPPADKNSVTALYMAAQNGYIETVLLLLKHGTSCNVALSYASVSFLIEHVKKEHQSSLSDLFKEKNITTSFSGFTPLHAAIFMGHQEIVTALLQHQASIYDCAQGISAYEFAKVTGHTHLLPIEYLQEHQHQKSKDQEIIDKSYPRISDLKGDTFFNKKLFTQSELQHSHEEFSQEMLQLH
jgi:ankyrin repeat protein